MAPSWQKRRADGQYPISPQAARRDSLKAYALAAAPHVEEDFMSLFTRRQLGLLSFSTFVLSSGLARAAELDPAAVTYKLPD